MNKFPYMLALFFLFANTGNCVINEIHQDQGPSPKTLFVQSLHQLSAQDFEKLKPAWGIKRNPLFQELLACKISSALKELSDALQVTDPFGSLSLDCFALQNSGFKAEAKLQCGKATEIIQSIPTSYLLELFHGLIKASPTLDEMFREELEKDFQLQFRLLNSDCMTSEDQKFLQEVKDYHETLTGFFRLSEIFASVDPDTFKEFSENLGKTCIQDEDLEAILNGHFSFRPNLYSKNIKDAIDAMQADQGFSKPIDFLVRAVEIFGSYAGSQLNPLRNHPEDAELAE